MRNGFLVAIGYSLLALITAPAQDPPRLPLCGAARPATLTVPWSGDGSLWCLERVADEPTVGGVGYTALAAGPPGALYAVMPDQGALVRFDDTDGDLLPDTPTTLADGLARPTGLTLYAGALYVAGLDAVYRYSLETGVLDVLVKDFPGGWDGWPSGGVVVSDNWLYVGAGGDRACTAGRGSVWRYRLDGSGGEVYATGLRGPLGLAVLGDHLYVADAAADVVWRVAQGADYGACSGAAPPAPVATFAQGAAPVGLAAYAGDLFPVVAGRLLVALSGSSDGGTVRGYAVVGVDPLAPAPHEAVLPRNPPHLNISDQRLHAQGSGFYPHHVYGVAVGAPGWIYVSAGGGKIVALRNP